MCDRRTGAVVPPADAAPAVVEDDDDEGVAESVGGRR